MSEFQVFNKNRLYVIDANGGKVDVPPYVDRARKRFRYSEGEKALEKQCFGCHKWFKVAELNDGQWNDIHSEDEIHLMDSGFDTYCQECSKKKEKQKSETVNISQDEEQGKHSIYMSERHRRYLKMRAAAENKSMKQLIHEIFEKELRDNPLERFL